MFTRSSFNYNGPLWFLLLGRIVDETLFLGLSHGPILYSPTIYIYKYGLGFFGHIKRRVNSILWKSGSGRLAGLQFFNNTWTFHFESFFVLFFHFFFGHFYLFNFLYRIVIVIKNIVLYWRVYWILIYIKILYWSWKYWQYYSPTWCAFLN